MANSTMHYDDWYIATNNLMEQFFCVSLSCISELYNDRADEEDDSDSPRNCWRRGVDPEEYVVYVVPSFVAEWFGDAWEFSPSRAFMNCFWGSSD